MNIRLKSKSLIELTPANSFRSYSSPSARRRANYSVLVCRWHSALYLYYRRICCDFDTGLPPTQASSCSQDSWPAADRSTRAKSWEVPRATYFMPKLSWLQEGSTGLQWASDTKSSWRMRWQNSEKCSSMPDSKMLPWPSFEPGLLQPQCIELTTVRPQGTTDL